MRRARRALLPLVAALSGLGSGELSSAFTHGLTLAEYRGRVVPVVAGPGANRLSVERQYDPTIDKFVAEHGLPDFLYVASSEAVQLFYLEADFVASFQRTASQPASTVEVTNGIPEVVKKHISESPQGWIADPGAASGPAYGPWAPVPQPRPPAQPAPAAQPVPAPETQHALPSAERLTGRFSAAYGPPRSPAFAPLADYFARTRPLDQLVANLNTTVALPADLVLAIEECGTPNAFYSPAAHRISMCFELMALLAQQFRGHPQYDQLFSATFAFVMIHELGHALIHLSDLPVTGREEDAADQVAALALLAGGEAGAQQLVTAASWFAANARSAPLTASAFANEHSLDAQRFYNLICWAYGENPATRAMLVAYGYLPRDRAVRCPEEFQKMKRAWDHLLAPLDRGGARAQ